MLLMLAAATAAAKILKCRAAWMILLKLTIFDHPFPMEIDLNKNTNRKPIAERDRCANRNSNETVSAECGLQHQSICFLSHDVSSAWSVGRALFFHIVCRDRF